MHGIRLTRTKRRKAPPRTGHRARAPVMLLTQTVKRNHKMQLHPVIWLTSCVRPTLSAGEVDEAQMRLLTTVQRMPGLRVPPRATELSLAWRTQLRANRPKEAVLVARGTRVGSQRAPCRPSTSRGWTRRKIARNRLPVSSVRRFCWHLLACS